ncbi:MAG: hypothetical protein QOD63_2212 [Actinomycetota bacterium]|nr:hypothetical protein [Actinomycetota bacterium]
MPTFPIGTPSALAGGGHSLNQWQAKVAALVRDEAANVDFSPAQLTTVGIAPAVAKYSVDRPQVLHAEVAGAGSPYLALPAGWIPGISQLTAVEFPARMNPPTYLDSQRWQTVRSPTDVTVEQILLDATPGVTQYVRLTFTARWPLPTTIAADDLVDDVAFEAVTALAARFCCVSAAGGASRDRDGAFPSDFAAGQSKGATLMAAAKMYRDAYDSFLGIGTDGKPSDSAPAWGSYDLDPSRGLIYHGGRR